MPEAAAPHLRARTEFWDIGSPRTPNVGEAASQTASLIAAIEKLNASVVDVSTRQQQAELQSSRNAGRLEDSLHDGLATMRDEMRVMQARQRELAAQCEALQGELADSHRPMEIEQRSEERLAWFSPQERTQRSEELQGSDPRDRRSEE